MISFYRVLLMMIAASELAPACYGQPQPAETSRRVVRLEVTRDTWVSDVGREADGNNGGAPRLKLKSIQEMTLLDVDATPLGAGRSGRPRST